MMQTVIGLLLLFAVLAFAIVRPRGLPEAVAAVPAAACAVLFGLVPLRTAADSVADLGSTLGFLAAVLILAHLADLDGVFGWLGDRLSRSSGGSATRVLTSVFVLASVTTAVLSLDATVVLLTPAILVTMRTLRLRAAPVMYATAHLSNSASLLMPVSNLTNLLAFGAAGVSFLGFTALMALPWVVSITVEYLIFRRFFRTDLATPAAPADPDPTEGRTRSPRSAPRLSLAVIAAVLAGFAVGPIWDIAPGWIAAAGAAVLAVRAIAQNRIGLLRVLWEANPLFLIFVAALSIVVDAATGHGLEPALARLLPAGESLPALLGMAVIAAVLANLVNNLPATLVLLAALGPSPATGLVLAMLIGVNIGPNLTYTGSLATLLWRRVLHRHDRAVSLKTFTQLGLLTVPACLVAGTCALWAVLQLR